VARSAVAICLPADEFAAVSAELAEAGYEAIAVKDADELEDLLARRSDVGLALLDGENDFDSTIEMYGVLHEADRDIPSLMVVSSTAIDRLSLAGRSSVNGEFVTRPFSASTLRWRVEAMLIRDQTMLIRAASDVTRSGPILGGNVGVVPRASSNGQIVIVFNPKGGVGKTTIAVNTAAMLQLHKRQRVLLIDCDAITGHVVASLGMVEIPTVVDVWKSDLETGKLHSLAEIASPHSSGVQVLTMSRSPLHTEVLEPSRVAKAIMAARDSFDWVIVDMHPDYGPLNQGIFAMADQILVPVTPEVPTIRAAVQFREVANELEIRNRLELVVNRYNSGISSGDVEKVVGFRAIGRVRSAGMMFVQAANSGRTAVEEFPKAKVVGDIEHLAGRLIAIRDSGGKAGASPIHRGFARPVRELLARLTASQGRSN
jgi:pilus assembly protein CpaE